MAQPELHSTADISGLMAKARMTARVVNAVNQLTRCALQCLQESVPLHEWRDW
jgi:hypothetical protein